MSIRNNSMDTWKGIAIIAVIGIHASSTAENFPLDSLNYWVGLVFRSIFNFAVAVFFAFSGYFSKDADEIWKRGILSYYVQRLSQLWIPYVTWTGAYLFLYNKAALLDFRQIAQALFLGTGIGIGYFVIVLTSLIVLHPFVARLSKARALVASALISAVSVALLYFVRIEYQGYRFAEFPYTLLPFSTWMVFYYLGFYLKGNRKPLPFSMNALLGICVGSCVLNFAESVLILNQIAIPSLAVSQVKFTTYFYSIAVSVFAIHFGAGYLDKIRFLAWAGKRSYVLYLCHLLFLVKARNLLGTSGFPYDLQVVYIPVSIALTALVASGCVALAEFVLPHRLAFYVLGVKKAAKRVPDCAPMDKCR